MDLSPTAAKPSVGDADDRGRSADAPSQVPARGWKDIALRTWRESSKDNVGLVAAGVAFYGFLALVPMLGAIVLTYGLMASPETVARHAAELTTSLPADVAKLIGEQLSNVVQTSGGKKGLGLIAALALALWGARNSASAIITALNIAYGEEEDRGIVQTTLLALAMTAGAVALALLAGGAITLLGFLQTLFPTAGPVMAFVWKVVTYALLGGVAAAAAATLYRFGPARERAKWRWITPGTLFFAAGWVLLTLGFGFYVANFGKYGATYGSLSAVVVLVTWLYLSSYVLVFGAELNSEVEHQTAEDTTSGADKPLGERGAWSANHVAGRADDTGAGRQGLGEVDGPAKTAPVAPHEHKYLASRVTSRAARIAGNPKVGMFSSVLATAGLGMLRRRGRAGAGAALLGTAAGIALLKRKD